MVEYNINQIKEFFKDPNNISLLNKNKFNELFQNWEYYAHYNINELLQFLIDADINFISYLTEFKYNMFEFIDFKNKPVILSNKLEIISQKIFGGSNITDIIIPNGLKVIGDFAFYDCKYLTNITIPDSVTKIGKGGIWIL